MFRAAPIAAAAFAALLAACAATRVDSDRGSADARALPQQLPVVLWFDEHNEVLAGTATRYDFLEERRLDLRTQVGAARCIGSAVPRLMPLEAEPPLRCDGIERTAELTCSDGRLLALHWLTDPDCGSGYGKGEDQDGHPVHALFDGSPERSALRPEPPSSSASYPLGRLLYFYVVQPEQRAWPEGLRAFLAFALTEEAQEQAERAGFLHLTAETATRALQTLPR